MKIDEEFLDNSLRVLMTNRECLVAKWIIENPTKSIEDCRIIEQRTPEGIRISVETNKDEH